MLTIRPARAADTPALLTMIHALAAHHGDPPACTATSLERDVFGPAPWMHVLIAHHAAPVGYAALVPTAQLQFGVRGMDLHHLFVHDGHRGTGLGAALVRAARDHALDLGCAYLTVGTAPDNRRAQAFYQRQGFVLRQNPGARLSLRLANA